MYKHLRRVGSKEDGAKLLLEVWSDRTIDNGYILKYRQFHSSTKKIYFFYSGSGQIMEQTAQKCCGVPLCQDVQNLIGYGTEKFTLADPALRRGLD